MLHASRLVVPRFRAPAVALLAAILLLHAAACGGGDPGAAAGARADSAAPRPLAEGSPAVPAVTDSAARATGAECPMVGLWQRCSVVKRIEGAGLGPVLVADEVRQEGIGIAGAAYRLGSAELQLFLFADSADAARQAATLRPDDAEPAEVRGIRRAPLVVRSQNLVALVFDNNDRLRERVQLALSAGLPRG